MQPEGWLCGALFWEAPEAQEAQEVLEDQEDQEDLNKEERTTSKNSELKKKN